MRIIVAIFLTMLMFIGCSSSEIESKSVKAKLALNQNLSDLRLNDQFGKEHSLKVSTKKVIFAFSKDIGHICNEFFATKESDYLSKNNTMFVADISQAPSLVRSMFILPGLKDFKYTVLILDDEVKAQSFKKNQNLEKIVVVSLENKIIKSIKSLDSIEQLEQELAK